MTEIPEVQEYSEQERAVLKSLPSRTSPPMPFTEVVRRAKDLSPSEVREILVNLEQFDMAEIIYGRGWRKK
jgi:hypothetical protein